MKTIYLIRHGETKTFLSKRLIGQTETEMNDHGYEQIQKISQWLKNRVVTNRVECSDLNRAEESARIIKEQLGLTFLSSDRRLREIYLGDWENISLATLQAVFPEEYEERGKRIGTYVVPKGESFKQVQKRAYEALINSSKLSEQDILIVTHAGVIRSLLSKLENKPINELFSYQIPFASVTMIDKERLCPIQIGYRPLSLLDETEIRRLWDKYGTGVQIREHMMAVARLCEELLDRLPSIYDRDRIKKAALLHDLVRFEKNHAAKSADLLVKEGWNEIQQLVRAHHDEDCEEDALLSEEELLYYADKRIHGNQKVTIHQRFESSKVKCLTDEAMYHHDMRYRKALTIEKKIRREGGNI